MAENFTNYAFSKTARALQEEAGSRDMYAKREAVDFRNVLTPEEDEFIESCDGFYLSSVNVDGWPYVQYRGGPQGFLQKISDDTLAFADLSGNKQFLSRANIQDSGKVCLFIMDYANRDRLKIWAEASFQALTESPELAEKLTLPGLEKKVERIVIMKVKSFDWNCHQHITQRYTLEELRARPELIAGLS